MPYVSCIVITLTAFLPVGAAAQSLNSSQLRGAQTGEKRPWVGVAVSPAPSELRHQLKLADGIGLIVEFVQPKSPAADADLKPFDLLLKLDDQWLVNPEQFAVLVRMHQAADEVKLTYIREGTEHTATAKLVAHELSRLPGWDGGDRWTPLGPDPAPAGHPPQGQHAVTRVLTSVEGHRQVSVTTTNDRSRLVVKNTDTGQLLFDGPIDTEEQRMKLPPDVRALLGSLMKMSTAFGVPLGPGEQTSPAHEAGKQP